MLNLEQSIDFGYVMLGKMVCHNMIKSAEMINAASNLQLLKHIAVRQIFPVWALVVSTALLFGWMHSPQGHLGMTMTAAVSLLLAGLFLWRGSLLSPLVAHYVVNLLQLLVAHRYRDTL